MSLSGATKSLLKFRVIPTRLLPIIMGKLSKPFLFQPLIGNQSHPLIGNQSPPNRESIKKKGGKTPLKKPPSEWGQIAKLGLQRAMLLLERFAISRQLAPRFDVLFAHGDRTVARYHRKAMIVYPCKINETIIYRIGDRRFRTMWHLRANGQLVKPFNEIVNLLRHAKSPCIELSKIIRRRTSPPTTSIPN